MLDLFEPRSGTGRALSRGMEAYIKSLKGYRQWVVASSVTLGMSLFALPYTSIRLPQVTFGSYNKAVETADLGFDEVHALLTAKMKDYPGPVVLATARQLYQVSRELRFRPSFILSVIHAESSFRADVVSSVGAIGLMQLMPKTAEYIAGKIKMTDYRNEKDLYRPDVNVTIGIHYLAYLRKKLPSSNHFLRAYNMGPTKLNRISIPEAERLPGVSRYVNRIIKGVQQIAVDARTHSLFGRLASMPAVQTEDGIDLAARWIEKKTACSSSRTFRF